MTNESNPIREIQARQFDARLKQLKEGFASIEKANVRTMPENIFVAYFLPFFCGESTDNMDAILANWYTIAGTNYSPINIVDKNGDFVIQVPPLHDRNVFKPILNRTEDMAYAMNLAKQKASLSQNLANAIVNEELGMRYGQLTDDADKLTSVQEQWNLLFKHYGKLPKEASVSMKDDIGDEFEY